MQLLTFFSILACGLDAVAIFAAFWPAVLILPFLRHFSQHFVAAAAFTGILALYLNAAAFLRMRLKL